MLHACAELVIGVVGAGVPGASVTEAEQDCKAALNVELHNKNVKIFCLKAQETAIFSLKAHLPQVGAGELVMPEQISLHDE